MKTTNKVELDGFIGVNPEVKTLKNGNTVANFTLSTEENYKNKEGEWVKNTTWHRISLWNDVAKQAAEILKKGMRISLTGRIVNKQYTDKDGNKRTMSEILANTFKQDVTA